MSYLPRSYKSFFLPARCCSIGGLLAPRRFMNRSLPEYMKGGPFESARPPQHIVSSSDEFWLKLTRTKVDAAAGMELGHEVMEKAHNRRRIATNLGMCVIVGVTSVILIQFWKKDRNIRHHQYEKEAETKRYN